MQKKMDLYICGVDWQHELGQAADGTLFYPSIESLKKYSPCWSECGIVKVTATFDDIEWVEPQDFSKT
jgi:hypothetical protein